MSNIGNRQTMAKNLNYYIEKNNLDKQEMAQELGVKISTFYSWCAGTVYPRIDKIEKLANYLKIDKMDLIEEHDFNYENKKIFELLCANETKRRLAFEIAYLDDEKLDKLVKMIELLK